MNSFILGVMIDRAYSAFERTVAAVVGWNGGRGRQDNSGRTDGRTDGLLVLAADVTPIIKSLWMKEFAALAS